MSDYMPGAVQSPQPGGVTLDTSLPPRFVWHITWDKLDANGNQPAFSAVANYLKNVGYCPHIMWNPFTGEMEQYYPASVGSRALAYNDQDGAACVQVEILLHPRLRGQRHQVQHGRRHSTEWLGRAPRLG